MAGMQTLAGRPLAVPALLRFPAAAFSFLAVSCGRPNRRVCVPYSCRRACRSSTKPPASLAGGVEATGGAGGCGLPVSKRCWLLPSLPAAMPSSLPPRGRRNGECRGGALQEGERRRTLPCLAAARSFFAFSLAFFSAACTAAAAAQGVQGGHQCWAVAAPAMRAREQRPMLRPLVLAGWHAWRADGAAAALPTLAARSTSEVALGWVRNSKTRSTLAACSDEGEAAAQGESARAHG